MNNDFQLALAGIAIGIVVIVVIYNRWQESRHRKQAERAFQSSHADVLIDERVEPNFGSVDEKPAFDDVEEGLLAPIVSAPITPTTPKATVGPSMPSINEAIDTVALVLADQPMSVDKLWPTIEQSYQISESILWEGLQGGLWLPINDNTDDDASFREVRAGLQLANRTGAVDAGTIAAFDEMMVAFATQMGAVVQREDRAAAVKRAATVDAFCAESDIEIAINIIGKNGVTFATTKVRGLAEAAGMTPHTSGEYVLRDELGYLQFVLRNMSATEPPGIKQAGAYLTGLSLALDVPRTHEPAKTFERLMAAALRMADTLQGEVVDDNRKLLTANGRKVIADTIRQIADDMNAHGVAPGSSAALRLYS